MKALLLLLFTVLPLLAQDIDCPVFVAETEATGGGSNPPASPLVNQNFEGAGYDNSETWTEGGFGTKDEDYTTSPAPLLGSQSLYVDVADSQFGTTTASFTAGGERWGFAMFNASTVRNGNFVAFYDSGFANMLMSVEFNGSNLRVVCGSASSTPTVATFSTGTTYYLWWHYLKGTGADAVAEAWFSTTTTKPADGSDNHTKLIDGTSTTDANILVLGASTGAGGAALQVIYDHVYVDDEAILSNP